MIFRFFIFRDFEICQRAFITYVRSIIEYNIIVLNPCAKYLIAFI
jgi:hypothetical protein